MSRHPGQSTFHLNDFIGIDNSRRQNNVDLRLPSFIGDFCLNENRNIVFSKTNLKYIYMKFLKSPEVPICFDLNEGLDKVCRKDFSKTKEEKLDRLLKWILKNKFKFETGESKHAPMEKLSTDFICFRGLLTEILCTPYERREGWIIHATKFRDTIYLLAKDTPQKAERRSKETDTDRKMSSWGFKFEQYMTSDDTSEAVNENEEYCCVLRSRLNSNSLVYAAEVDGVDESLYHDPHSNLKAFIELKTCKRIETQKDVNNFFRFRLKKWYLQSHLAGIPQLICGFRDQEGVVTELKSYSVEEMPNMAKIHWDKNLMFNFLDCFLCWLKKVVVEDNPDFVYEIVRPPNRKEIFITPLGMQTTDFRVLTKEYTDSIF